MYQRIEVCLEDPLLSHVRSVVLGEVKFVGVGKWRIVRMNEKEEVVLAGALPHRSPLEVF